MEKKFKPARVRRDLHGCYFDSLSFDELMELERKDHDAQVQSWIGFCYESEEFGMDFPKDYEKAFEWYQKAADQGSINAQFHLGLMYHKGLGVEANYEKAVEWYQKAVDQGHARARKCLIQIKMENGTYQYKKRISHFPNEEVLKAAYDRRNSKKL